MDDYGYDLPERFKAALEEWKKENPDIQKLCEELDNKVIIKELNNGEIIIKEVI